MLFFEKKSIKRNFCANSVSLSCGNSCLLYTSLCAAGHRTGAEGLVPNWQDRIPLELYFIGDAVLLYITLVMADSILSSGGSVYDGEFLGRMGGAFLCVLMGWVILLAALMTIATRLKLGTVSYTHLPSP